MLCSGAFLDGIIKGMIIDNFLHNQRIIINGNDKGSKNHPWRFIRHCLWYFSGSSLHRVTSVSGLEPTAAGPYAGISDRMAASHHVERVIGRVTADPYTCPHVNSRDPDPWLPVLGLPGLADYDRFGDRDRCAFRRATLRAVRRDARDSRGFPR